MGLLPAKIGLTLINGLRSKKTSGRWAELVFAKIRLTVENYIPSKKIEAWWAGLGSIF